MLKKRELTSFCFNPFEFFGNGGVAIAKKKDGTLNPLTVGWGTIGKLWSKNVIILFIRDSRFSHEFFLNGDVFSFSSLEEGHEKDLSYLGSVSGRNEDKLNHVALTLMDDDGIPYILESKVVILARKLKSGELTSSEILDESIKEKYYPNLDEFHSYFIGEIVSILS